MKNKITVNNMRVWAILNLERYIKASIQDGSLAIFDDEQNANKQVHSVSRANDEVCFVEELSLLTRVGLDELLDISNEMYEMLDAIAKYSKTNGDYLLPVCIEELEILLAKARGESCK